MKHHHVALHALALVTLASGASAQVETFFEYDAGSAGNPSTAPLPSAQGWALTDTAIPPAVISINGDGATNRNAVQMVDSSSAAGSTGRFERYLTAAQSVQVEQNGFRLDMEARMIIAGPSRTISFEYFHATSAGWERFLVYLDVDGIDVLAQPFNGLSRRCEDAMDGDYHTFTILRPAGAANGEIWYDGLRLGLVPPLFTASSNAESGVAFGAGSSSGTGSANFTRVSFGSLRPVISNVFCSPANPNSTGDPAMIEVTGSRVASTNDVVLYARRLPANQFGFFINGESAGFASNAGGSQGNLCLGGTLGRYNSQIVNSGPLGEMFITLDLTQTPVGGNLISATAGQTLRFQGWFRDTSNGVNTSNFTNAARVTLQ